ncbi:MAG TPA: hypothetical protein VGR37_21665 [Longimicrobiaceae bacterium]|nr:hypothetical protein [Longimicrobiaceae bacterium]
MDPRSQQILGRIVRPQPAVPASDDARANRGTPFTIAQILAPTGGAETRTYEGPDRRASGLVAIEIPSQPGEMPELPA